MAKKAPTGYTSDVFDLDNQTSGKIFTTDRPAKNPANGNVCADKRPKEYIRKAVS